ncbi:MAG: radical SAM protein [Euryarchaeota archaeon]|nr:radical SAM protein [Euryarchaeota archaeon]
MLIYYPGKKFPSISITGPHCALRCKHCNGVYLQHMIPITTPEKLVEFAKEHEGKINGFLLSGGSNRDGKVPLKKFSSAVKWITEHTNLKVNVHTGIIDEEDIEYLEEMHPHHVSFDVIGATETVREVLGTERTAEDYFHSLHLLDDSSLSYSPHIIAGLHFGKIVGEYRAVEEIKKLHRMSNLVLIVLIPTRGTGMAEVELERPAIEKFFRYALENIAPENVVLGCMRPRDFHEIEELCVEFGCRGIVIPSLRIIKMMREMGMELEKRETCCVL